MASNSECSMAVGDPILFTRMRIVISSTVYKSSMVNLGLRLKSGIDESTIVTFTDASPQPCRGNGNNGGNNGSNNGSKNGSNNGSNNGNSNIDNDDPVIVSTLGRPVSKQLTATAVCFNSGDGGSDGCFYW